MELASTSAQWFLGAHFCKWDLPSEPLLAGCVIFSQAGTASSGHGPPTHWLLLLPEYFLASSRPSSQMLSGQWWWPEVRVDWPGWLPAYHQGKNHISCLWDHCFLLYMKNSWCCIPAVGISTVGWILRSVQSHLLSHLWEFLWPTSSLSYISVRLYKCIYEHTSIWIYISSCFLSCFFFLKTGSLLYPRLAFYLWQSFCFSLLWIP